MRGFRSRRLVRVAAVLLLATLCGVDAHAEKRVALVVGNGAYAHTTPLSNPLNDARDMTEALKATGFEVVEAVDADKLKLDGALRSFTDKLADADVALFFYAGHGLQVGAQNYLVPIDAKLDRERDLEFEAVKLDFVLRQMEIDREGKTSIVILDACRDNPLTRNLARSMGTRSTGIGRGLAPAATGLGTFIAYSTQPGNVALDGKGRNSPFTAALAKHVRVKGRNLPATMIEVRKEVLAATDGKQVPWDHSALTGDFYFVAGDAAPATGKVEQAPAGSAADVAALQARLAKLEAEAKARERTSAAGTPVAPAVPAAIPPVIPKAKPEKTSPNFEDADNVALAGTQIRAFRAPNPVACREACEADASCTGYQHGKKAANMGQCQLFSAVTARSADQSWRSGARIAGTASTASLFSGTPTRTKLGFNFYDDVDFEGQSIKAMTVDSADGCMTVCRNTSSCAAATLLNVQAHRAQWDGHNCVVYSKILKLRGTSAGVTSIVRIGH